MAFSDRDVRSAASGTDSTCAGVVTVTVSCHSCTHTHTYTHKTNVNARDSDEEWVQTHTYCTLIF